MLYSYSENAGMCEKEKVRQREKNKRRAEMNERTNEKALYERHAAAAAETTDKQTSIGERVR